MTLIRKSNEIELQTKIKALIYGQAGTGKTTLALSAPKPLLLDFDGGVSRINFAHLQEVDTVQIKNWSECLEVMREDLSNYETIVVDTIGKMLDFIIESVCRGRVPQINNWGTINNEFSSFCRTLSSLNKNIIFVAHRDNRKEGDTNVFVPAIREKSYNAIVTELDLMGYIESKDGKRVITFDFSDRNDGKNTCNLPKYMEVPTIIDSVGNPTATNNFVQIKIITPFVQRLQSRREASENFTALMEVINYNVELVTDAAEANEFIAKIDTFEHLGSSRVLAAKLLKDKANSLGLVFNAKSKTYDTL